LNKIHGPIGLDIKAKNPAEIAISILGEIIQFRRAN
jgi:xanthine/CO dehydrogenase XdhC/CoxF family maturation factor